MREYDNITDIQTSATPFILPDNQKTYISFCRRTRVYRKAFSFRELLGEEIAIFMGRDTIHYFLLQKENIIYLASYPFIDQEGCYPDDLKEDANFDQEPLKDSIPFFLERIEKEGNKRKFLTALYQTFAIDTYMRQTDRYSCNSMLYKEKKDLFFAPMYDYADSFYDFESSKGIIENFSYLNPFFTMGLEDYSRFLKKYPEFSNYLRQIQKIDLIKHIKTIKDKYNFHYSVEFIDYWKRQEEMSQKVIQRIL